MRKISKIPQSKIISEYRGKLLGLLSNISYPTLPIILLIISIRLVLQGHIEKSYITISLFILFTIIFYLYVIDDRYVPNKTFFIERLNKNKLNKFILICSILIIALNVILYIKTGVVQKKILIQSSIAYFVFYYWLKSIKFHEDIDYESNEYIADLVGISVDEKIVTSYQNFDSTKTKRKKNDNLIVVTNRKIFFAVFNGKKWLILNKLLIEVEKIGIARKNVNSYLKLVFDDKTTLGLRLDFYEKITTTPQLFVKQFLSTLDASLMGFDVVCNNNRKRVSIANNNESRKNNSSNQTRIIELNPTLLSELKVSEEIKPGRILEI
jgi:hypothetical protein